MRIVGKLHWGLGRARWVLPMIMGVDQAMPASAHLHVRLPYYFSLVGLCRGDGAVDV